MKKEKKVGMSFAAYLVLRTGLPLIAAALLALTFIMSGDLEITGRYALITYHEMYGYIMMSLSILVGGAFLVDYGAKREETE